MLKKSIHTLDEAVEYYHEVMGGLRHTSDSLAPLYTGADCADSIIDGSYVASLEEEEIERKLQSKRRHANRLLSSHHINVNLFGSDSEECAMPSAEDVGDGVARSREDIPEYFNMFAATHDRYDNATKTRRITYMSKAATDIDPIELDNLIEGCGDDRQAKWATLRKQLFPCSRSSYTLSAYCAVVNKELESEMLVRTTPIIKFRKGRFEENKDKVITGWGRFSLTDNSTTEGKAINHLLCGATTPMSESFIEAVDLIDEASMEQVKTLYEKYELYNEQDYYIIKDLKCIEDSVLNTLVKATLVAHAFACVNQCRKGQEGDMMEAAAGKIVLNEVMEMKRLLVLEEYEGSLHRPAVVIPDKDWVWDVISRYENPDMYITVNAFESISFQRSSMFVKMLTQCSVFLFANYVRIMFLRKINDYIGDTRYGRKFYRLTHGTNLRVLLGEIDASSLDVNVDSISLKCGSCPILKKDVPITDFDLDTTMLSVCELNSYFYECPLTDDLEQYLGLLLSRYACFSWFQFSNQSLMNSPAYVDSQFIDIVDKATGKKQSVQHKHVNMLFFRFGMLMLLPMVQEVQFWKGVRKVFKVVLNANEARCGNKEIGFSPVMQQNALKFCKSYQKNEIVQSSLRSYKSKLVQFLLRPGETALFKMRYPRADPYPLVIINNMRPQDMDRYNRLLLDDGYLNMLDRNIYPYQSALSPLAKAASDKSSVHSSYKTNNEITTYEAKTMEAIESALQIKNLDPEWAELIKVSKYYVEKKEKHDTKKLASSPSMELPFFSSETDSISEEEEEEGQEEEEEDDLYTNPFDANESKQSESFYSGKRGEMGANPLIFVSDEEATEEFDSSLSDEYNARQHKNLTSQLFGSKAKKVQRIPTTGRRTRGCNVGQMKKEKLKSRQTLLEVASLDFLDDEILYGTKIAVDFMCTSIVETLLGKKRFSQCFYYRHKSHRELRKYLSLMFNEKLSNIYTKGSIERQIPKKVLDRARISKAKISCLPQAQCYQCCGGYAVVSARMNVCLFCSTFLEGLYYWFCMELYSVLNIAFYEVLENVEIGLNTAMETAQIGKTHMDTPAAECERMAYALRDDLERWLDRRSDSATTPVSSSNLKEIASFNALNEETISYLHTVASVLKEILEAAEAKLPKKWAPVLDTLLVLHTLGSKVFALEFTDINANAEPAEGIDISGLFSDSESDSEIRID